MPRAGRSASSERPARSPRIVRLRKVGAPDVELAAEVFGPLLASRLGKDRPARSAPASQAHEQGAAG